MQNVGLAKVAVFTPFTSFLVEGGSPLERHLTAAGIDPLSLTNPNALIPLHWACSFIDRIGRLEGIKNFGFEVGSKSPIRSMGPLGEILSNSLTLKDLIERLLKWIPQFDSGAHIWTEPGSSPTTLKLCIRHEADIGRATADGFALMTLIDAVRMALGPNWRPQRYWITRSAGTPEAFEALSEGRASHDVRHVAFEIPMDRMGAQVSTNRSLKDPTTELEDSAPQNNLIGSLTQALQSSMGLRLPVIEEAAALAQMSPRSLQRRLRESGLSYRNLVDRVRHDKATAMLEQTGISISDVAHHLGYRDPANFNHAFLRWTGKTPTAYRSQTLSN